MKKSTLPPLFAALLAASTIVSCSDEVSSTLAPVAEETEAAVKEVDEQYTFHYQGKVLSQSTINSRGSSNLLTTANWFIDGNDAYLFDTPKEMNTYMNKSYEGLSTQARSAHPGDIIFYTQGAGSGRQLGFRNRVWANIPGEGDFNNNIRSYRVTAVGSAGSSQNEGVRFYDYYNRRGLLYETYVIRRLVINVFRGGNASPMSSFSFEL